MIPIKRDIRIVSNLEELAHEAAEEFILQMEGVIKEKEFFTVALCGGSTPKTLYSLLANDLTFRKRVVWDKIQFFWGDERHVPPDHPNSNYLMAYETMLSKVPIPQQNVHRVKSENPDACGAAEEYEQELYEYFCLLKGELPRFDLILLGMGADGHTASIFPGTEAVNEGVRLAIALWVDKLKTYRITLTPPVLNNAACIFFLVSGEDKAETLRAVLEGDYKPNSLPSQIINPDRGKTIWFVDRAASLQLRLLR